MFPRSKKNHFFHDPISNAKTHKWFIYWASGPLLFCPCYQYHRLNVARENSIDVIGRFLHLAFVETCQWLFGYSLDIVSINRSLVIYLTGAFLWIWICS